MNTFPNAAEYPSHHLASQDPAAMMGVNQHYQQQQQQNQQQSESALPSIVNRFSPVSAGIPIAGNPAISSYQLASVATSPLSGTPSSMATGAAGMGGFSFNHQPLISPGAISPTSSLNDYGSSYQNLGGYPPAQQPLNLAEIPVTHSYSYQPTTHHSHQQQQQFPNVLINGASIDGLSSNTLEQQQQQSNQQHNDSTTASGAASQASSKQRPSRNKSKFKRFRNAFIYFVNDQRDKVDDDTKKLKNREFLQLMSARWKSMSEDERKPYVRLAEEDKKRFNEDVQKFGKYESRQRRYNKPRSLKGTAAKHDNSNAAHHVYGLPNAAGASAAHMQSGGGAAAAAAAASANLLYNAGGYGNMVPTQMNNAAAVPSSSLSQLYTQAAPNASSAAAAAAVAAAATAATNGGRNTGSSWGADLHYSSATNPRTTMLAADIQQQMQQQSSLLTPTATATQKTPLSSTSSNANDIGSDIGSSLSPGGYHHWAAFAGDVHAAGIPHDRYYAAYYQQQQPHLPNYLKVPTGAPLTHSLTEPSFPATGQQNPLLGQDQQIHQMQQQQQQQQQILSQQRY